MLFYALVRAGEHRKAPAMAEGMDPLPYIGKDGKSTVENGFPVP
jgi:hypothetical protein